MPDGIKVKRKSPTVVRNTQKDVVLNNLVADKINLRSSNDANIPRPNQTLMDESLQVPHPFEKGKTVGYGEFKKMGKLQASKFRDMGITDMPAYQQKAYDTALAGLEKFPEAAVDKYQNTRSEMNRQYNVEGIEKKPMGRLVSGGTATYAQGTGGIKIKKSPMPSDATSVNKRGVPVGTKKAVKDKVEGNIVQYANKGGYKNEDEFTDALSKNRGKKTKVTYSTYAKGTKQIKVKK